MRNIPTVRAGIFVLLHAPCAVLKSPKNRKGRPVRLLSPTMSFAHSESTSEPFVGPEPAKLVPDISRPSRFGRLITSLSKVSSGSGKSTPCDPSVEMSKNLKENDVCEDLERPFPAVYPTLFSWQEPWASAFTASLSVGENVNIFQLQSLKSHKLYLNTWNN